MRERRWQKASTVTIVVTTARRISFLLKKLASSRYLSPVYGRETVTAFAHRSRTIVAAATQSQCHRMKCKQA